MSKITCWMIFLTGATWLAAWLLSLFLPSSNVRGIVGIAAAACLIGTGYSVINDHRNN